MKKLFKNLLSVVITLILVVICLFSIFFKNNDVTYQQYYFRNDNLLVEHYEKHGQQMGFDNMEDYQKAASDVINNANSLHKIESDDGDDIYYLEDTNEYVILSKDGYIRTYFYPEDGKDYFDRK